MMNIPVGKWTYGQCLAYHTGNTDTELALQDDDMETAAILLNDLPTDDLNYIEENYKTLYTLCIAYKSSEGLNESHKLELETLCAQCPETDGACIYQARALYMLVNGEPYEATLCTDDEGGRKAFYPDEEQKNNRGRVKAIVYPNPTSENVTIKLNRKCNRLKVSVHDVSGRVVLVKEFGNQASLYQLQFDLEPGVYYFNLSTGHGQTTKKVVVAR